MPPEMKFVNLLLYFTLLLFCDCYYFYFSIYQDQIGTYENENECLENGESFV